MSSNSRIENAIALDNGNYLYVVAYSRIDVEAYVLVPSQKKRVQLLKQQHGKDVHIKLHVQKADLFDQARLLGSSPEYWLLFSARYAIKDNARPEEYDGHPYDYMTCHKKRLMNPGQEDLSMAMHGLTEGRIEDEVHKIFVTLSVNRGLLSQLDEYEEANGAFMEFLDSTEIQLRLLRFYERRAVAQGIDVHAMKRAMGGEFQEQLEHLTQTLFPNHNFSSWYSSE